MDSLGSMGASWFVRSWNILGSDSTRTKQSCHQNEGAVVCACMSSCFSERHPKKWAPASLPAFLGRRPKGPAPAHPPAFLGDTPKDRLLLAFLLFCLLFVRTMLTDEQKNKDVFLQEQGHCFKYVSFLMSSRTNIPLLICLCSGLIQ